MTIPQRQKEYGRGKKREKSFGLSVQCGDMPFEKALRMLKKKVEDSGLLKEIRDRQHYEKPTTLRKKKKAAAKARWAKKLREESLPVKQY